jgi:hypothetical protein
MASTTKNDEALMLLWAAHFAELNDMTEADIMEGVDLPKLRTDQALLLASVKAEASRRRLDAAKQERSKGMANSLHMDLTVSVVEARAFLKQSANDPRITMAARELDDMSDDTVMRMYARLQGLLSRNPGEASS